MPKVHNDLYAKMNACNAARVEGDGAAAHDAIVAAITLIDDAIGGETELPKALPKKLNKAAAAHLEASLGLALTAIVNDQLGPARDLLVDACGAPPKAHAHDGADTAGDEDLEDDAANDGGADGNPGPPEKPQSKTGRRKSGGRKKRRKKAGGRKTKKTARRRN